MRMKERIVQAVYQEMYHCGLKFSIRDLANRLGISTKTIYQHFESKALIIDYMVEQSIAEMMEAEKRVMDDASRSLHMKLQQALTIVPRALAAYDMRLLQELEAKYPSSWSKMDTYIHQGWDNIRRILLEGIAQGEFRHLDIECFIHVYIGAFHHWMDPRASRGSRLTLEKFVSQLTDLLLDGIRSKRDEASQTK